MRTTLTLDDDVAAALADLQKKRGVGLKPLVNEALREGLKHLNAPPVRRKRFRTVPVDLGPLLIGSIVCTSEALAIAEGEAFK